MRSGTPNQLLDVLLYAMAISPTMRRAFVSRMDSMTNLPVESITATTIVTNDSAEHLTYAAKPN
jgi:hypothetical protein